MKTTLFLKSSLLSRSSCPPGWSPHGSRCFIFINSPHSWAQAERYCLHLSANLVSIHSAEEHCFIQELVRRTTGGFPYTWIGATDISEVNGLWFWTDGSRFDFEAWGSGEPNNGGGTEACVEINSGAASLWNDFYCDRQRPFVCAMKLLSC
uniref:C-type lectin domain-containing protein n=1 Tax=Myripristis murdjan TaxID=586833 RepID=A0A667WGL1_9TELE